MELQEVQVLPDQTVQAEPLEHRELLEPQVLQVLQEQVEHLAQTVQVEPLEHRGLPVHQVLLEHQVLQVHQVLLEQLVLQEQVDQTAHLELLDLVELLVSME